MIELTPMQERLCQESIWDFSALRALYINCTLKRSPEVSNTQALAGWTCPLGHCDRVVTPDEVAAPPTCAAAGPDAPMTPYTLPPQ